MDKTTSRSLEMLMFAGSLVLPGAFLAYAWFVLAPGDVDTGRLEPRASIEIIDTSMVEDTFIGATVELWSEEEEEPWVVAAPEEKVAPVDLPLPVPSVPQPPTLLPVPGPRLEHTGDLPRWGEFPVEEEVLLEAEAL